MSGELTPVNNTLQYIVTKDEQIQTKLPTISKDPPP